MNSPYPRRLPPPAFPPPRPSPRHAALSIAAFAAAFALAGCAPSGTDAATGKKLFVFGDN